MDNPGEDARLKRGCHRDDFENRPERVNALGSAVV
jgi:hypothetical protein